MILNVCETQNSKMKGAASHGFCHFETASFFFLVFEFKRTCCKGEKGKNQMVMPMNGESICIAGNRSARVERMLVISERSLTYMAVFSSVML